MEASKKDLIQTFYYDRWGYRLEWDVYYSPTDENPKECEAVCEKLEAFVVSKSLEDIDTDIRHLLDELEEEKTKHEIPMVGYFKECGVETINEFQKRQRSYGEIIKTA